MTDTRTVPPEVAMSPALADRLMKAIDARNADAFCSFLTPDCVFRFGNGPAVVGHCAIRELVAAFFARIAACEHRLIRIWNDGPHVALQGEVTYTRTDGQTVTVPFMNAFEMRGDKIATYSIHIDNSPLFA